MSRLDELNAEQAPVEDYVFIKKVQNGYPMSVQYQQGKIKTPWSEELNLPKKLQDRKFNGYVYGFWDNKEHKFFAVASVNDNAKKNWETRMCDLLWLQNNKFTVPTYDFNKEVILIFGAEDQFSKIPNKISFWPEKADDISQLF